MFGVAVENGVWDWAKEKLGFGKRGQEKDGPPKQLPDTPVTSSYLRVVGYDDKEGSMVVEFQDGAVIKYFGVPYGEYRDMMDASSHGQFFYYNIRDDYRWVKLKDRVR